MNQFIRLRNTLLIGVVAFGTMAATAAAQSDMTGGDSSAAATNAAKAPDPQTVKKHHKKAKSADSPSARARTEELNRRQLEQAGVNASMPATDSGAPQDANVPPPASPGTPPPPDAPTNPPQ